MKQKKVIEITGEAHNSLHKLAKEVGVTVKAFSSAVIIYGVEAFKEGKISFNVAAFTPVQSSKPQDKK